ncbi:hypothetical protein TA3x_003991 [Tundrisphaera sp. TA3]|uniref:hypothetical protein n=1 Tax=Tundrisphaera sp. TA3 TaxID=3435775 RepID=UPI003EB7B5F6
MTWPALLALALIAADRPTPFAIEVVDAQTKRGVPLIELRTVNDIRLVTDSHGLAAFDEPGLMDQPVFFHVKGHGYDFPKDGFGQAGKALNVKPGGVARIEVRRVNIAERRYRVTGGGIYRDSLLLGRPVPIRQPALNAQVFGSDSVQIALFGGKIRWFWGDTNRPKYPLGLFDTPTASSKFPADGGLDPDLGVDLDYSTGPDGFAAASAKMPGPGPTWIDGVTVVPDATGRERLFAAYAKIKPPMETYERGLIEFDPRTERFAKAAPIPLDAPIRPFGHPSRHSEGGVDYVYFADPYPLVRVPATAEAYLDLARYEAFTCLLPGSTTAQPKIDRDETGAPRYAWRQGAPTLDGPDEDGWIRAGRIDREQALHPLRDADTGRTVVAHRGSAFPNPFRNRWVMIACEIGGTSSNLGEIWYAEADAPLGPWVYARKVVTHDKYSFYNPRQHPEFAKDNGRTIYFEGTYTASFSGNTDPTPRYDYNQIMYRLDLGDDRLNLPVPVYRQGQDYALRTPGHPIAFFARDRPAPGTIPVKLGALEIHALPADLKDAPATTVPLYATPGRDGAPPTFATEPPAPQAQPIARVWRNPTRVVLPGG